ncbi:hypothetical protein PIB30_076280 [Stylosanthes scabra]|uniref:Putative plant transposon protein domain-containing protein n=1 Tax=Stylosanthes scabra TaxID=79078 RepID=A0ABU6TSD9_9FABA|nr:hypothetical protein [Stylosanthes scabra]
MASSSAPASVLDDHRFRKEFNQTLFESRVRRKKVIPEVGFNLNDDKYPQIKEQIALRGWRRLAAPMTGISKLLVQEFYATFVHTGSHLEIELKPTSIPIQLKRTELHPLAKGWQEFIIHSLVPTGNKSEITVARAILIHSIMRGEEVRAEDIIADNMAVIAQGLQSKGNLGFPSTIYKLCKDAGVPLREFRRTSKIQQADGINEDTKKSATTTPPQQPFPDFQPHYESQYHQDLQGIEEHLSSMQFLQQSFYESMQKSQADYMEEVKQIKAKQEEMWNNTNRFHSQIKKEQEMLARDIQEVRKGQISQTLVNNQRAKTEKSLQQAVERQGRDILEMRKQLNLWTRNTSAREAYTCWAH